MRFKEMRLAGRAVAPALALAVALAAGGAAAQYGRMFQESGLSNEDMQRAIDAAVELVSTEGVGEGDEVIWSNPESDAVGVVETTAIEEDGRCVAFKHLVRARPGGEVVRYDGRRCRSEDGEWKIAPK